MELTCESLGITKDDIEEKVVSRIVETLLSADYMDEDGYEGIEDSRYMKKLKQLVIDSINTKVGELAEKHILPNVSDYIENLTIKKTNQYGEKQGQEVTFIEYLVQQAEKYMTEPVNHQGKSKDQDSYSWSKSNIRLAYMIDKHLHYSIEIAMKNALKDVNNSIAKGLAETVKLKLAEVLKKLKVEVKT